MRGIIPSLPHIYSWCGASLPTIDCFTFTLRLKIVILSINNFWTDILKTAGIKSLLTNFHHRPEPAPHS
jgi:hypothetical protein